MIILFDARFVRGICGASRYGAGLMAGLCTSGAISDLILIRGPREVDPLLSNLASKTVNVSRSYGLSDGLLLRRFRSEVDDPVVYYNPLYYVPKLAPSSMVRVAVVHDAIHDEVRDLPPLKHILYRSAMTAALASRAVLITPSQASVLSLRRHYSVARRRRLDVVYPAVTSADGVDRLPGDTTPTALYVGNLRRHKNVDVLIAAMQRPELRRWKLEIAGPSRAEFCGDVPSNVNFIEHPDDDVLAELYRGATVVVQPSVTEGFGLPIVEAFGAGAQVACSTLPVFHEVAGDAAFYFSPHDSADLAAALLRAEASPRPEAVLKQVASRFTAERAAASFLLALRLQCDSISKSWPRA